MKVYCHTNVIVAATIESHQHHSLAFPILEAIHSRSVIGVLSCHGLAEIYAILSRVPLTPRLSPPIVWQLISDNVLERFEVIALTAKEYQQTIHDCALLGWSGGRIYDALHLKAAGKAKCERIYTFNVRHFQQMVPDQANRIVSP